MVERHVLFVHDDKELSQILDKELSRMPSWVVAFESFSRQPKQSDKRRYDLVILESKKGWMGNLQQIQHHLSSAHPLPIMVIPPALLKKNSRRVLEVAQALFDDSERPRSPLRQIGRSLPQDPFLEDFVERKLKEFVKKIKASQSRNLYTLLLKEIERPLISLTLKETNGNQIQAALILGMNRNTLRKKIKELKIPLKRR